MIDKIKSIKPDLDYKVNDKNQKVSFKTNDIDQIFEQINQENVQLKKDIETLVKALHKNINTEDQLRYINLFRFLQKNYKSIFAKLGDEKTKKNICDLILNEHIKQSGSQNLEKNTKIKSNIDSWLRSEISNIVKTQIQDERSNILNTIESFYNKDNEKRFNFIGDVLSNKKFITNITSNISNFIIVKYKENQNKLYDFFKNEFNNTNISKLDSDKKNLISDFKSGIHSNPYFKFLIKYNNFIYREFKKQLLETDVDSIEKAQRNAFSKEIHRNFINFIRKPYKNTIGKLKDLCSVLYWKRKMKSFGKGFVKFLASAFTGGLKLTLKLGWGITKLGLYSIQGLVTSIFSIAKFGLNAIKNIIKLTFNLSKTILSGAAKFFKRIKLFFLTPTGAYILGFIIGFFKQKIMGLVSKLIEKYGEIKDKFKKKHNEWKEKYPLYAKISSTIDTIWSNTKYIVSRLNVYTSLLGQLGLLKFEKLVFGTEILEDELKLEKEIRENYNQDMSFIDSFTENLSDIILGRNGEEGLIKYTKMIDNFIFGDGNQKGISDFMKDISMFAKVNLFNLFKNGGASAVVANIASTAIGSVAGAAIGFAFGGPVGMMIGSGAGAIIGKTTGYFIERAIKKIPEEGTKRQQRLDLLSQMNEKWATRRKERKLKESGKLRKVLARSNEVESNLQILEAELDITTDENKKQEIKNEIKRLKTQSILYHNMLGSGIQVNEEMLSRIEKLDDNELLGTNPVNLWEYIFRGEKKLNRIWNIPTNAPELVKNMYKTKAQFIRNVLSNIYGAMRDGRIVNENDAILITQGKINQFDRGSMEINRGARDRILLRDRNAWWSDDYKAMKKIDGYMLKIGDIFNPANFKDIEIYQKYRVTNGEYHAIGSKLDLHKTYSDKNELTDIVINAFTHSKYCDDKKLLYENIDEFELLVNLILMKNGISGETLNDIYTEKTYALKSYVENIGIIAYEINDGE